ncbi:MAG: AI-2E family transporter [Acidimicrobiia bacterium]|nr:AI-2E family transporter [Acidimicrobiia bacterium]MYD04532.1 AI-2E family transporter [Acidimicrobiia bacterium]
MEPEDRDRINRYDWLRGVGVASWSVVGLLAVTAIFVWLIYQIRIIWVPLILAVLLTFLVKPAVDFLENRRVPRVGGGCLVYLLLGGVLVVIGVLIVPIISQQATDLADRVPEAIDSGLGFVEYAADSLDLNLDVVGAESLMEEFTGLFSDPPNLEVILDVLTRAGEFALGVVEGIAIVLLAPVLAFYILVDTHNLRRRAERLIPPADRAEVIHVAGQVSRALSGFIRGQLMVALIVGILSSLALWVLDLPFWLIVGLLAGLLNIVPFIGPWVGGALGVTTALIVGDPIKILWVIVAFVLIQQFDNHLVSPLVLRAAVKLSPVTIILVLLVGGSLGGLFGVLIAVPTTAVLKIVLGHLWRTRVLGESWEEVSSPVVVEFEGTGRERLGRTRLGAVIGPEEDQSGSSNLPDREESGEDGSSGEA